jgi:hypothetical protein
VTALCQQESASLAQSFVCYNPRILIAVRIGFAEVPLDLAVAAPPPAAGFDERDPTVCVRWMARVAMHLDDALDARAAAYEDAASPGGGGARSPSYAPSEAGARCGLCAPDACDLNVRH